MSDKFAPPFMAFLSFVLALWHLASVNIQISVRNCKFLYFLDLVV